MNRHLYEVTILNTLKRRNACFTLFSLLIAGFSISGQAQETSPLEVEQHPPSPAYESLFPNQVVPLDRKLSWTDRFNGDESFNPDERLPSTGVELNQFGTDPSMGSGSSNDFDGTGVVKQIKSSENKIKIEHGPIDRLGMPAMTMLFRVADPEQLSGLDKGAEVAFDVDNTSAGFTITRIEKAGGETRDEFQARGMVKQVRASQGKVKIEHGPIDSLGMPAMTMLFKVNNADELAALEKGMAVEFDVVNSASGFEIPRIRPIGGSESFDARGTVKQVRASQGKVKIEHGPIDSLGMPGMTMLFKLTNPEDLEMLEPGMDVEFDVVNGAGGFEIPRIRPLSPKSPSGDAGQSAGGDS